MKKSHIILATVVVLCIGFVALRASATPEGPTIQLVTNTTKALTGPQIFNGTGNGTADATSGGYIYTFNLSSNQKNLRWKAFVGNVTGKLVLAGADNYAIYDWSLTTTLTGEVYATRASATIVWSTVNCSNSTQLEYENSFMSHTSANDNVSATFNAQDNDEFQLAGGTIPENYCYTTNLYVNGAAPGDDAFEEVVLIDDSNNTIYAALVSNDHDAYMNGAESYDFQMIVPEIGTSTWTGATAYYLYIELA